LTFKDHREHPQNLPFVNRPLETLEEPKKSDFCSLGEEQCVVDVNSEIADGVFDLAVTQQDLDGSGVSMPALSARVSN
jgi:hypothetical protein